jgi:hypothetical protein
MSLLPEDELWTFHSENSDVTYTVTKNVARLSTLFSVMMNNAVAENKIRLTIVTKKMDGYDIIINTDKMLGYVYKYFKIWENDYKDAQYIGETIVQTNIPEHLLQERDIKYIQDYLNSELPQTDMNRTTLRKEKIKLLGILLTQTQTFLGIESLAHKIYIYIATMIWDLSVADFAELLEDPKMQKLHQNAIDQWIEDNPRPISQRIKEKNIKCLETKKNDEIIIRESDIISDDDVPDAESNSSEEIQDDD